MLLIEQGNVIPQTQWQFDRETALEFQQFVDKPRPNATIVINPDDDCSKLSHTLDQVQTIIIEFDSFADGRIFSVARQLRQSFDYQKRIILCGPMIADQYGFAIQCGVDAIMIPEELIQRQPIELFQRALKYLPLRKRQVTTQLADNVDAVPAASDESRINLPLLNQIYQYRSVQETLRFALSTPAFGKTAIVSSFGTESAILLHHVAMIDREQPIIFIDTEKHFPETLAYKEQLTTLLGLKNVISIRPQKNDLAKRDADGILHMTDTTTCCYLRKVLPLEDALEGYDTWISGRKYHQSESRRSVPLFERSGKHLKVNPLIHWSQSELAAYMDEYDLPPHPLAESGYRSIGCSPCTTPVAAGEQSRAGRWRNESKTECGIHFVAGETTIIRSNPV